MAFGSTFGRNTTSTTSTSLGSLQDLQNDVEVPAVGDDSISDLAFSPVAEFLATANWDGKVRIYEINVMNNMTGVVTPTTVNGRAMYTSGGPVLSCRFSTDGTKIVSGGADKQVKLFDLASQQAQTIGQHADTVKAVRYVQCGPQNTQCVVSGSWDRTVKYWDMRQPNPICTLNMPERVYTMDSSQKLLVVGTAQRHVEIINLDSPDKIFRSTMSPLKLQTRSIGCYPKGDGFAIGSIEGRCGIQYIDKTRQNQYGFSFKCQRQQKTSPKQSIIYSVNSIVFHPVYGTFATAGSDGSFCFWDKDSRHRLRSFPSLNATIPVANFNRNGGLFAYALSYDWSKGYQYHTQNYTNKIRIHACKDEDVKPRGKKK